MTQDIRGSQLSEIYQRALTQPASERERFIQEACGKDEALRQEVESLLALEPLADRFMESPAVAMVAPALTDASQVSRPADMIGRALGPYTVTSRIDSGAMGDVYRARDSKLGRDVAIKILPPHLSDDPERRARFVREARVLAALKHPHIGAIYGLEEGSGISALVLELVEGQTLASLIERGPVPIRKLLDISAQIADGMASAHAAGITHRDLKPANIMVAADGRVKILDFGLAKQTAAAPAVEATMPADRTEPGMIVGTVNYMSPEQARGEMVDYRSDQFSFGVVLYEMATGRKPFARAGSVQTMAAIISEDPSPIDTRMPAPLRWVIDRCLAKDPAGRYESSRDLFRDLATIRQHLSELSADAQKAPVVGTTEASTRHRWGVPPGRRRAAIALGAVVVAAAAGGISWLGRDRPGAATPTTAPRLSTGGPPSSNPEANRYFEAAVQTKVTLDLIQGQAMLARALELDPHFAEARAWYGFTNWLMLDGGYSNDSALLYHAEDEVRRALKDDPSLVHAHAVLAAIYFAHGRKELVPAELEQALNVNPTDEYALHWLMHYHHFRGDYASADRVGRQNLERNPLFFPTRMILGDMLRQQGDLAGATREQERILEQDPENPYALRFLARVHLASGDLVKARQTLDRARPSDRQSYASRLLLAIGLARDGRRAEAHQVMTEDVLKWASLMALMTSEVATFYAVAGEEAKALDWLDRAVRNGDERAEYFRRDPLLAAVRDHPRFHQILQSIAYRRQQR